MKRLIIFSLITFFLISASSEIKLPKPFKNDFKFVPSGLVKLNGDTLSVQSFYMLAHEVTNAEYFAFYEEIEDEEVKKNAAVNVENWRSEFKYSMDKYSEFYYKHPAYAAYPVVNVTHEGALNYCKWLEKKINNALAGKQTVKVRLPNHEEIIRAAAGDDLNTRYAWKGQHLRNEKGEILCNFTPFPQELLTRDSTGAIVVKKDLPMSMTEILGADVLAPSKSYFPSEFGVYNLNGNAAEMTMDPQVAVGGSWRSHGYDVRIHSVMQYNESSAMVGFRPVFTVVK